MNPLEFIKSFSYKNISKKSVDFKLTAPIITFLCFLNIICMSNHVFIPITILFVLYWFLPDYKPFNILLLILSFITLLIA